MKTNRTLKPIGLVALMLSTLNAQLSTVSAQGSLTPTGAPQPTMKTLSEIEPRKAIAQPAQGPGAFPIVIHQPGSYYLAGEITGVAGQSGIVISTNNVTLDLNGFALVGNGSGSGVEIGGGLQGVSVRNGLIRAWAVGVSASTASGLRFTDLVVANNASSGILGGNDSIVSQCSARQNGDRGIQISAGIVSHCTASSNNIGITVSDGSVINSSARGNTTGIVAIRGLVENSVGSANTGDGIFVSGGKVLNCIARSNTGDGIEALAESIVSGNVCSFNGAGAATGAGIHCTGDKNHVEGNNVFSNDVGIDVNDIGVENNVIVRNTASCNTSNYDIGVNNQAGTIGTLATIGSNPWGNVAMTGFCN